MGLFTLLLIRGALVVLILGIPLVPLILASQNVNGLLLPIVLFFALKLANDRQVMGEHRNGSFAKIVGTRTALVAGALSVALVVVTVLVS